MVEILHSMRSIKDVRIEVAARAFGVEWAAQPGRQATFTGVCKTWVSKSSKRLLFVKWEDTDNFVRTELFGLRLDTQKQSLNLRLLAYADGRPAPELVEAGGRQERQSAVDAEESDEEADSSDEDEASGAVVEANPSHKLKVGQTVQVKNMKWALETPTAVSTDPRAAAGFERNKPALNGGG